MVYGKKARSDVSEPTDSNAGIEITIPVLYQERSLERSITTLAAT